MGSFTMDQARLLIKRELGVDPDQLSTPPEMNGNPDYPWYSMNSGNQRIKIHRQDLHDTNLIALSVSFENSISSVTEYFYADTLEFADECTQAQKWEDIAERTNGVDVPERLTRRLKMDAQAACWKHTLLERAKSASALTAPPSFQDLCRDTKEFLIKLWDEDCVESEDAEYGLSGPHREYIATIERWSAQGQPHLGPHQEAGFGHIVDAIDTMLYYEAHPEETVQEKPRTAAQEPQPEPEPEAEWEP